jgi:5-methylcytosine-specific restriction enzyme A
MRRLYGTERWRRLARAQIRREPLCALCLLEGRGPVVARVADHIEPWRGDVNKFWLGKLQSLCEHCHNSRKKDLERLGYDRSVGVDGLPLDPNHPIYRT